MPIRKSADVKTDTFSTHYVRIEVQGNVLPDMSNDDICFVEVIIRSTEMNRPPVVKRVKLNYRDMTTLCSEFVIRDF